MSIFFPNIVPAFKGGKSEFLNKCNWNTLLVEEEEAGHTWAAAALEVAASAFAVAAS